MDRIRQLMDKDVRYDAPDLSPGEFLQSYLDSNFPQTSAHPSAEQKAMGVLKSTDEDELNFNKMKRAPTGVGYDRPQVS